MMVRLQKNRVFRSYRGGAQIDRLEGKPEKDCRNDHFPEDWTASVVRAFNPGRETIQEGYGRAESGEWVKDLVKGELPILVKLLDAAERLVVQVHPDNAFARKYFHSRFGKTECWYFLNCAPDACVYIGFREGITPQKWQAVFEQQDIPAMLGLLHRIPVRAGDCVFIDGGLPHAIGAGCFMIELQEPSDFMAIPERVTPSGCVLSEEKMHGGLGFHHAFQMYHYVGFQEAEIRARHFIQPIDRGVGVTEIVGAGRTDKFTMMALTKGAVFRPSRENVVAVVVGGVGTLNDFPVQQGDRLLLVGEKEICVKGNAHLRIIICY